MAWTLQSNVVRNPLQTVKLMDLTAIGQYFAVQLPDFANTDRIRFGVVIYKGVSNFSGLLPSAEFETTSWDQWANLKVYKAPADATIAGSVWFYIPEKGRSSLRIKGLRLD